MYQNALPMCNNTKSCGNTSRRFALLPLVRDSQTLQDIRLCSASHVVFHVATFSNTSPSKNKQILWLETSTFWQLTLLSHSSMFLLVTASKDVLPGIDIFNTQCCCMKFMPLPAILPVPLFQLYDQSRGCSGHDRFLSNHMSIHILWYIQRQGNLAMVSPCSRSSKHITHSPESLSKTSSLYTILGFVRQTTRWTSISSGGTNLEHTGHLIPEKKDCGKRCVGNGADNGSDLPLLALVWPLAWWLELAPPLLLVTAPIIRSNTSSSELESEDVPCVWPWFVCEWVGVQTNERVRLLLPLEDPAAEDCPGLVLKNAPWPLLTLKYCPEFEFVDDDPAPSPAWYGAPYTVLDRGLELTFWPISSHWNTP